jgi:cellulose synthase/poly-beta-1,6-N-acetylglucosamine synthase-like glycosyltransferase
VSHIAIIAIGRNEGERLRRCLQSALGRGCQVVYVDSRSSDGSAQMARSMGVEVMELDMSLPFSAARARNAGFEKLAMDAKFVQFVDGDCELVEGWIERASNELEKRSDAALVCGRRRERHPEKSVYNRLADLEWDTPVGETLSCGGDAMMRVDAFRAVGGFDPSVVAGEEPELCQRFRQKGWKILRIDAEMTIHDSAMLHLTQWWRRAVRGGYGAADVARRFGAGRSSGTTGADGARSAPPFSAQVRSARIWTIGWLLAIVIFALIGFAVGGWKWGIVSVILLTVVWPAEAFRIALKARRQTATISDASAYGFLTMVSKWANLIGELEYRRDRRAGKHARLIEYKQSATPAARAAGS